MSSLQLEVCGLELQDGPAVSLESADIFKTLCTTKLKVKGEKVERGEGGKVERWKGGKVGRWDFMG